MKINTNDKKIIIRALYLAIDSECALIDAYTPTIGEMDVYGKELTKKTNRSIKSFERIIKTLKNN